MTIELPRNNYDDLQPIAEVVSFVDVPWEEISPEILAVGRGAFPDPNMIRELDMVSWYMNPDSVTVILRNAPEGAIVGYATTLPAQDIYHDNPYMQARNADAHTAYIPLAFINKAFQGKKLIAQLMQKLENELAVRGYQFIERDVLAENGYADKMRRHYKDRIVFENQFETSMGNNSYFRIKIEPSVQANQEEL